MKIKISANYGQTFMRLSTVGLFAIAAAAVLFSVQIITVPLTASAEDKAIPGNDPKFPIPDPFPRTIIAAKSSNVKLAAAKSDRKPTIAKTMLASAGDLINQDTPPNAGGAWGDSLAGAYTQAINENKAMLILFWYPGGPNGEKMSAEMNSFPELSALSKCAVPVKVNVLVDDAQKNVTHIIADLNIPSYPLVSLLVPTAEHIYETGHVLGYMSYGEAKPQLDALVKQALSAPTTPASIGANLESCRELFAAAKAN